MVETYPITHSPEETRAGKGYTEVRVKQVGTNPDTFKELKRYNSKNIALSLLGAGIIITAGSLLSKILSNKK
jgi:hypothetical protein